MPFLPGKVYYWQAFTPVTEILSTVSSTTCDRRISTCTYVSCGLIVLSRVFVSLVCLLLVCLLLVCVLLVCVWHGVSQETLTHMQPILAEVCWYLRLAQTKTGFFPNWDFGLERKHRVH